MYLTLLKDGVFVMIIGIGTVFVFLTIMVWIMYANSYFLKNVINKYFPEEVPAEKAAVKKAEAGNDSEIAAAVACALKKAGKAAA